jgi:hypothetical protein
MNKKCVHNFGGKSLLEDSEIRETVCTNGNCSDLCEVMSNDVRSHSYTAGLPVVYVLTKQKYKTIRYGTVMKDEAKRKKRVRTSEKSKRRLTQEKFPRIQTYIIPLGVLKLKYKPA